MLRVQPAQRGVGLVGLGDGGQQLIDIDGPRALVEPERELRGIDAGSARVRRVLHDGARELEVGGSHGVGSGLPRRPRQIEGGGVETPVPGATDLRHHRRRLGRTRAVGAPERRVAARRVDGADPLERPAFGLGFRLAHEGREPLAQRGRERRLGLGHRRGCGPRRVHRWRQPELCAAGRGQTRGHRATTRQDHLPGDACPASSSANASAHLTRDRRAGPRHQRAGLTIFGALSIRPPSGPPSVAWAAPDPGHIAVHPSRSRSMGRSGRSAGGMSSWARRAARTQAISCPRAD